MEFAIQFHLTSTFQNVIDLGERLMIVSPRVLADFDNMQRANLVRIFRERSAS